MPTKRLNMGGGGDDSLQMAASRNEQAWTIDGDQIEGIELTLNTNAAEDEDASLSLESRDEIVNRALTEGDIRAGLQDLGPTASGLRQAYLKISIIDLGLTSLAGIEKFKHIQTFVASNNNLSDISCLGSLRSLTHLDVSQNKLSVLLDITPPPLSLRFLDVSNNNIATCEALATYKHLEEVRLNHNIIENIDSDTLQALPILKKLSISDNKIKSLQGVHDMKSLKYLDLSRNQFTAINELKGLNMLTHLDISGNGLLMLTNMEELPLLGTLLMEDNCISSLNGLLPLQKLTFLRELSLMGNTLTYAHKARLHTLYLLPCLTILDGTEVLIEEKVEAANLHGADIEGLRSIRAKFFPNNEEAHLHVPNEHSLANKSIATDDSNKTSENTTVGNGSDNEELNFDIPLDDLIDSSEFGAYILKNTSNSYEAAQACFNWMKLNLIPPMLEYQVFGNAAIPEASPLLKPDRCSSEIETMLCTGICRTSKEDNEQQLDEEDVEGRCTDTSTAAENRSLDAVTDNAQAKEYEDDSESVDEAGSMMGPWSLRVSELYQRLVASCNIECSVVQGVARFPGMPVGRVITKNNHHWNVIVLDNCRYVVDCSWAVAGLEPNAFCVPPDEFIYQRFPEEPSVQLLDASISFQQFWTLPYCLPSFFEYSLQLQNHANSIISVKGGSNEVLVTITAPPNIMLYHVLRSQSSSDSAAHRSSTAGYCEEYIDLITKQQNLRTTTTQRATGTKTLSSSDIESSSNTLAQRDLNGDYVLRTALKGFESSFIFVFAYDVGSSALSTLSQTSSRQQLQGPSNSNSISPINIAPRLVLCYRVFREQMRVLDDSGREKLHSFPISIHSNDMDNETGLSYPIVTHDFTRKGCTIIEPIVGRLVERSIESFRIRVPGALTVSVAGSDGFRNILSRQYLRKATTDQALSDVFEGEICIPANSCVVFATFPSVAGTDEEEDNNKTDDPVLLQTYEVIKTETFPLEEDMFGEGVVDEMSPGRDSDSKSPPLVDGVFNLIV